MTLLELRHMIESNVTVAQLFTFLFVVVFMYIIIRYGAN